MYDNDNDDVDSSTGGKEDAPPTHSRGNGAGRMVLVIVLLLTTLHLRSSLGAMGVDLQLLYAPLGGKNNGGAANGGGGEGIVVTRRSPKASSTMPMTARVRSRGGGDKVSVHAELDAIKRANDENDAVTGEVKTKRRRRWKYSRPPPGNGANLRSPLFVCGDKDCSAVYELLVYTCGLSVFGSEATATGKSPSLRTNQSMPSVPVRCPRRTLGMVLVYWNHPYDCGFFSFAGDDHPLRLNLCTRESS